MISDPIPLTVVLRWLAPIWLFCILFFQAISLAVRYFLRLQEASGDGQPLWTEGSSLLIVIKEKRKTRVEQTWGATPSCARLKESLNKPPSFPSITLSHKYSTSLTSPSPSPHTAALQTEHQRLYSVQRGEPWDLHLKTKMPTNSGGNIPRCA